MYLFPPRSLYLLMSGAYAVFSQMIFVELAVYYVLSVRMNPFQLVLVGTVLEAAEFIFEVPTGVIADAYSRRAAIIAGEFLFGLSFVIAGSVALFPVILLANVILALGWTFISGALIAWLTDEVGDDHVAGLLVRGSQVRLTGGLVGILVGAVLASIRLNLPIVLGGVLMIGLSLFLMVTMPEGGFRPHRPDADTRWRVMRSTLTGAVRTVQRSPTLLAIVALAAIYGGFSEGVDRLWEAHFLRDLILPPLGGLKPVSWFGIIAAGGSVASLGALEVARKRVKRHRLEQSRMPAPGGITKDESALSRQLSLPLGW